MCSLALCDFTGDGQKEVINYFGQQSVALVVLPFSNFICYSLISNMLTVVGWF